MMNERLDYSCGVNNFILNCSIRNVVVKQVLLNYSKITALT